MRRRIILVVIIVGVLGVLCGGAWWYFHRGGPLRLRTYVELAIQAKQLDLALERANAYIARYPQDWYGPYMKGRVYIHQGKYDEARKALQDAARLDPKEISVPLTTAATYSLPAQRAIAAFQTGDTARLTGALERLQQAEAVLLKIDTKDDPRALDVTEAIGLNWVYRRAALKILGEQLKEQMKVAQKAGARDVAEAKRKESEAVQVEEDKARKQAIAILLQVVQQDASRPEAGRALVQICLDSHDEQTLAEARGLIMAAKDPAPAAVVPLVMTEIAKPGEDIDVELSRDVIQRAAKTLDGLLSRHPDDLETRIARARVALLMKDTVKVLEITGQILKNDPRQGEARLLQVEALLSKGDLTHAEKQAYELKTDRDTWAAAQFVYARAALAAGKLELGREAMRTVTVLKPDHLAARRFLAEMLLREGFYDQAFSEADALYTAHPDSPQAVRLFAEAAKRTSQPELARHALEKALKEHSDSPQMLMVVAEGYAILGDSDAAVKYARRVADMKPTTADARLAVAGALILTDRTSEAEKMLTDELLRNPNQARVHFELGRVFDLTGRKFQALDEYREAVKLDSGRVDYKFTLARALYDMDDLDECERVLDQLDPTVPTVGLLRLKIRQARGDVDTEQILRQTAGEGLAFALNCLNHGNPQKCVEICEKELKKSPDDHDLRQLLAQGYLAMGNVENGLKELSTLIKAQPDQMVNYRSMASVLNKKKLPPQVEKDLVAVPGARREMVDLAMAWLYTSGRDYKSAADAYRRHMNRPEVPEQAKNRARLLLARVTAQAGYPDEALQDLDQVAKVAIWREPALALKAEILLALNRASEVQPVLAALEKSAVDKKDAGLLRAVSGLYAAAKNLDKAVAVCDQAQALLPNDVRSYTLKAMLLGAMGKSAEAEDCLRKAIECQPGNFQTYLLLARTQDANGKPLEALDTLTQLAKTGPAGRAVSLLESGSLFSSWGLQAQATERFEELSKMGYSDDPRIELALGTSFARLQMTDRAAAILKNVPQYASQYIDAQLLLVEMAETTRDKLEILNRLETLRPGNARALQQKMQILSDMNRPVDVIKVYDTFAAKQLKEAHPPDAIAALALQAMLQNGDRQKATDLAAYMAGETKSALWKTMAALLLLDGNPDKAMQVLGDPDKTEAYPAILGAALASRTGKPVAKWQSRIARLEELSGRPLPASYKILLAVATGNLQDAEKELAKTRDQAGLGVTPASELVSNARKDAAGAAEAFALTKASMAIDARFPALGKAWAMERLNARPTCQWAATLALGAESDPARQREILKILQPPDSVTTRVFEAGLLVRDKQYDKAIDLYDAIAKVEKNSMLVVSRKADLLQRAGRLPEALALYQQVWTTTQDPTAANNAAYLVSQLSPHDSAKLSEAQKWIEAAVKSSPGAAPYRDTLGWLMFLQGSYDKACYDKACAELHRAIKGIPDSAEAHYHLGMAERAVGHEELGKWHLEAAVAIGKGLSKKGVDVIHTTSDAVREAQKELGKLK